MNSRYLITTLALATALLNGCANAPGRWQESATKAIGQEMSQATEATQAETPPIPPEVSAALLPPLSPQDSGAEGGPREQRFDLSANNTPARTVFMSLVKGTPYSMVIHPQVKGTISLQLKDVTIEESLKVIREIYGYDYRREGNRFLILGPGMQTRIYPVNYLNFNRKGHSNTRVSSGELSDIIASSTTNGNTRNISNTQSRRQGIQVDTLSESNFWKTLKKSLEDLIGKKEGRRVVIDPQAGMAIIRALPGELETVRHYLELAQATINRQVILEAKIIEVELKDGFQSGINWAALGDPRNTDVLLSQVGGGSLLRGSGKSVLAGSAGNVNPGGPFPPLDASAISAFGGIFSISIQGSDFAAFFEFLKSQGDVHLLSSPRVSTVNNQKAVIKVGGDEFFVTGVSNEQITTGNITTLNPQVELTPFFSGIALDVIPQIDEQEHVILHIHPTISEVTEKNKSFVVSGEDFDLPLANRIVRESDNVVRARSGQIIIIGGLMKEASTADNASVPLLGDIPLLGNLFKHQRITRIKKELVILLKPSIMGPHETWNRELRLTQQRLKALDRGPRQTQEQTHGNNP
ncbi:MAG: pilus (MSHA type) biogenesis protein MshL [Gammaproteobacteria bacterium]